MSYYDRNMNDTTTNRKANKARLDNRWGCSVGHAFHNLTRHPVSTLTAAPAVPALDRSPE
jgi:hypothetical protein